MYSGSTGEQHPVTAEPERTINRSAVPSSVSKQFCLVDPIILRLYWRGSIGTFNRVDPNLITDPPLIN